MNFSEPEEFSSALEKGTHTLLLYEDKDRANSLRIDFVKNGLEKNQSCVYITTENDSKQFKKALSEKGVDIEKLEKDGLFHILNVENPFTSYGSLSKFAEKISSDISKKAKSPIRIACNFIGDVTGLSENQVNELLENETSIHNEFGKSEDYLFCTYYVGNINSKSDSKFLDAIRQHHSVMFAPLNSKGIGFNLS